MQCSWSTSKKRKDFDIYRSRGRLLNYLNVSPPANGILKPKTSITLALLSTLFFASLSLSASLDEDCGLTLDDFAPDAPWKRFKLPHLDTFADQSAFEADVDDEVLDLSLNPRSAAEVFGITARAGAATCSCPAGYKSCCPKWYRCFKPAPEKTNCCKVKTGTVACQKPKSCCYKGCVSLPSSLVTAHPVDWPTI